MNEVTLRELCAKAGVTRRAVQGYEAMGLVKPSGKNDRGYLLYDLDAQRRVQDVKELQNIGFSLKVIVEIIDAPNEVKKRALISRARELQEESEYMEEKIRNIKKMIDTL